MSGSTNLEDAEADAWAQLQRAPKKAGPLVRKRKAVAGKPATPAAAKIKSKAVAGEPVSRSTLPAPAPAPAVHSDRCPHCGRGGQGDALAYLLAVVDDPEADPKSRIRAAVAAAQYQHRKKGDVGKKDEQKAAAIAPNEWDALTGG